MLLTLRRLGPKSDIEKTARIIHSAQRTFARFVWFPILAFSNNEDLMNSFLEEHKD